MAWRLFQSSAYELIQRHKTHTAKSVVFMWPICGSSIDFSSQAELRKVTLSENILVVHVCGRGGPEEL